MAFKNIATLLQLIAAFVFVKVSTALEHNDRILINKPAANWDIKQSVSTELLGATMSKDGVSVRCYCNLPVCVATGYMCRSERGGGGCFSDLQDRDTSQAAPFTTPTRQQDVYKARHGCLELLDEQYQPAKCRNSPQAAVSPLSVSGSGVPDAVVPDSAPQVAPVVMASEAAGRSLLLCCFKDMCNHVDIAGNIRRSAYKNESTPGLTNSSESQNQAALPSMGYNSNEVWFKAATIAVPICGALILLMLIVLAVKILKTDSMDMPPNKLGGHYLSPSVDHKGPLDSTFDQYHQPSNSLKRVPLLLQHRDSGANVATSCTNHSADSFTSHASALPMLVQNPTKCFDKKNEANAKLNLVSNLEYSLLPQHQCLDDQRTININKPCNKSNVSSMHNNMYRNVNLSTAQSRDADEGPKLYDKQLSWGTTNPASPV